MNTSSYILTSNVIGSGSFGKVLIAKKDDKLFAAKELNTLKFKKEDFEYLGNEILISSSFMNKNLVQFSDIFEINSAKYLLYEYCNGGDLQHCLTKFKELYEQSFTEEIIQHIMKGILNGVSCLHRNKILHRDIKPNNILISFEKEDDRLDLLMLKSEVKISDFGLSKFKDQMQMDEIAGTPLYMDPQLYFKGKDKINYVNNFEKADIWSIGILAFELLTSKLPFNGRDIIDLSNATKKGEFFLSTSYQFSMEFLSFINACIQLNPADRLSSDELQFHEFLTREQKYLTPFDEKKLPISYFGVNNCISLNANDRCALMKLIG